MFVRGSPVYCAGKQGQARGGPGSHDRFRDERKVKLGVGAGCSGGALARCRRALARRRSASLMPGREWLVTRKPAGRIRARRRRLREALAMAVLWFFVEGAAQDASGHAGGAGQNLSEQQLEGVVAVERCAMERSKLDEQELLANKDRSMQELFERNRALASALHAAEIAKQQLQEQLQRVTAVNITDVEPGQEDAMRWRRFEFVERLASDALSEEPDAVRLMGMSERLLHVVREATGAGIARDNARAFTSANAGPGDTGGAPRSMHAAGDDAAAGPPWLKWKQGHLKREKSLEAEEIFSKPVLKKLRDEIKEMFHDAFDSYMEHAYPNDELRPLSCSGRNIFGPKGYSLTLIDSLDSLAILGSWPRFEAAVRRVIREVTFDVDVNVSVFETNIRAVGGLLSAHFLALKYLPWYTDELQKMCVDLADRCAHARIVRHSYVAGLSIALPGQLRAGGAPVCGVCGVREADTADAQANAGVQHHDRHSLRHREPAAWGAEARDHSHLCRGRRDQHARVHNALPFDKRSKVRNGCAASYRGAVEQAQQIGAGGEPHQHRDGSLDPPGLWAGDQRGLVL